MGKSTAVCYSSAVGEDLIFLCKGKINGVQIHSCHPEFRKRCEGEGRCLRYFTQGEAWKNRQLASILKKPLSKLTKKDKTVTVKALEKQEFGKCKKLAVIIKW